MADCFCCRLPTLLNPNATPPRQDRQPSLGAAPTPSKPRTPLGKGAGRAPRSASYRSFCPDAKLSVAPEVVPGNCMRTMDMSTQCIYSYAMQGHNYFTGLCNGLIHRSRPATKCPMLEGGAAEACMHPNPGQEVVAVGG